MENKKASAKIDLILSMTIFGTIGIFRNYIPLPSSTIAMLRGSIGMLFLLTLILCRHQKINFKAIRKNLILLVFSGAFIGINWILLFESYRYTTVATATLCYYMAPVFVIIASPFVLKEKLTLKKIACTLIAMMGMTVISGVFSGGGGDLTGVFLGLGAAVLYATVVILNKFIKDISGYERTLMQLGISAIAILPYVLITEDISAIHISPSVALLILTVGILHTGIAYSLYFTGIEKINAQTAAIFSYIDPVVALILSAVVLKERFTFTHLFGSILILGATVIIELPIKRKSFLKK